MHLAICDSTLKTDAKTVSGTKQNVHDDTRSSPCKLGEAYVVWYGRNTDEIGPAKIGKGIFVPCTLDCSGISASVFEICPLFRCKIQNSKTITLNEHGVVNLDKIKN